MIPSFPHVRERDDGLSPDGVELQQLAAGRGEGEHGRGFGHGRGGTGDPARRRQVVVGPIDGSEVDENGQRSREKVVEKFEKKQLLKGRLK